MPNGRTYLFSRSLFQSPAPFSHVVITGGLGHVSGIIGQRRDDGAFVAPDIGPQVQMMFDNLELVLKEAGYGLADLISTRLYLVDYAEFEFALSGANDATGSRIAARRKSADRCDNRRLRCDRRREWVTVGPRTKRRRIADHSAAILVS